MSQQISHLILSYPIHRTSNLPNLILARKWQSESYMVSPTCMLYLWRQVWRCYVLVVMLCSLPQEAMQQDTTSAVFGNTFLARCDQELFICLSHGATYLMKSCKRV